MSIQKSTGVYPIRSIRGIDSLRGLHSIDFPFLMSMTSARADFNGHPAALLWAAVFSADFDMPESDKFTTPQLKERGWTQTIIKTFLPEPDGTKPNPKYNSAGSPMKLYLRKRVERIEKSDKFKAIKEKANVRKLAARKAAETKRARMDKFVEEFEPEIPEYDKAMLLERAAKNFRSLGFHDSAEISDERMCVNYLRHCETEYERKLCEISGKTGVREAYCEIKEKILYAIAMQYDWLVDECKQQRERMWREYYMDTSPCR